MEVDIEKMLRAFSPVTSRNMHLAMVADSMGKTAENTTHAQQHIQTILVTNTALGSQTATIQGVNA
ncbi:hypothetical protein HC752_09990 [Vibrio sp. S9_S30]|uniref:RebB family R body protein n=1 Tax=Vibrio sp. S9_S30 TaxID=2720226 RepID=UPI001681AD99|nr:RebB family R body protein [Vibrio sp. S9_S30]MBD1557272.1 hypothetical protein [Vibrio sp. S9_S30]